LTIFRKRFPSKRDIALVFVSCVFVVHSWSILALLIEMPALLLRLSVWELIGVIAYAQVLALLESMVVLLVLVLTAAILPSRFLKDRFAAQGSMLVLLTSTWAIAYHFGYDMVSKWGFSPTLMWSGLFLASAVVAYVLILHCRRLEGVVLSLADRLVVPSSMYVALGLLGVVVVILRNA
jgi:hypothetical protein